MAPEDSIGIEGLVSHVRNSLDPALGVEITSSVEGGDLRLAFRCESAPEGRKDARWRVYAGFEVFSFWFGELWGVDFDYDSEVTGKRELMRTWIRLLESYFRGEGVPGQSKTLIRRRPVRELRLASGDFTVVLSDRPPVFGRNR